MGLISEHQIVHDVAEGYIEATGDNPAEVTNGNLAAKVRAALESGGGIAGGYTVKFKVDGDDYYIASCEAGNSVSEPSTTPTKSGCVFNKWQDGVQNNIEFPVTPNQNTDLYAYFNQYNFLATDGDLICTLQGRQFIDVGGTGDIVAFGKFGTWSTPILITPTQRTTYYTYNGVSGGAVLTSVSYNNTLYYVVSGSGMSGNLNETSGMNRYRFNDVTDNEAGWQSAALEVLEVYFAFTNHPVMPIMTSNQFMTNDGAIELTSSTVFGSSTSQQALFQPYKALDRKTGGTTDGNYFLEKNTGGFWCLKYPYSIRLKKLIFTNTYSTDSQYYTRTIQFYADEEMTIPIGNQVTANQVWQEIEIYDNNEGIVTDTIYLKAISGRVGIGELQIYGEFVNS